MLDVLAGERAWAAVVFTRTNHPRAAEPATLAERWSASAPREAETAADVTNALRVAREAVGRDGLVVVCGSLYLVGEATGILDL